MIKCQGPQLVFLLQMGWDRKMRLCVGDGGRNGRAPDYIPEHRGTYQPARSTTSERSGVGVVQYSTRDVLDCPTFLCVERMPRKKNDEVEHG